MQRFITHLLLVLFFVSITSSAQQKKFTVEEILSNRAFYPSSLSQVKWLKSGSGFSHIKRDPVSKSMGVFIYDAKKKEEKLLVSGSELKVSGGTEPMSIGNYEWSPKGNYILFTGMLYARTNRIGGAFYLFNLNDRSLRELAGSEETQMNPVFSPDETKLAFVRGGNVFVVDIKTGVETQLTFDGSDNILNGYFDWVYEEEFGISNGIRWSPDSKKIAFWRLDQTNVPEIELAQWDSLYLNSYKMKYPKAGGKNSEIQICVAELDSRRITKMDIGEEKDIYVPRMEFTKDPSMLAIIRMNRLQTELDILFADVNSGKTKIVLSEREKAWISVHDDLRFLEDGKHFIWLSEKDGFNHIYLYDISGKEVGQLTSGKWEVEKILGTDEKEGKVYFTGNERSPVNKDFYVVDMKTAEMKRITSTPGFHDVSMSHDFKYYIDRFSNHKTPYSTIVCSIDGNVVEEIFPSNAGAFAEYEMPETELLSFRTSDGELLYATIIKPAGFDEDKKYPVLFYNYSGPGSDGVVKDRWGGMTDLWHKLLAQKGYIIFMIDNRGTGGRGKEFKHLAYKRLGHWEINDHVEAVKYLTTLSYVDPERIGIWGWSYGGYVSALALMKAADYFKVAISVAPVIHWKFYDSIYTERFMSLPSLNPEGYEESSVLAYTDKLKGKLLLVHGTLDDNVHFQNSVSLVEKLISENKEFKTMYYPGKDHSIYGGKTRLHLFNMLTEFIENEL